MKKGELRLLIFELLIIIFLTLNSFIWSILNYKNILILLVTMFLITKFYFGFEKHNSAHNKNVIINLLIIILSCFILYYLSGLFIGFTLGEKLVSLYGFINFLFPVAISVILKEIIRFNLLKKGEKSKLLLVLTFILFVLLDVTFSLKDGFIGSKYSIFLFFALTLLPSISRNVTATFIAKKVSYVPNILWLLVVNLYSGIIPIIPRTGNYVGSLIKFMFPIVILYFIFVYLRNNQMDKPLSYDSKHKLVGLGFSALLTIFVVYFSSGFFKYYTVAIATGSMMPNIDIGDVVVIDQRYDVTKIKIGDILAHKYDDKIIVHRVVKIVESNDELYFYTKGDANNSLDNYTINKDMILGVVKVKVPYIGLPTVWLNDL